jgi:ribosomal-protein-serine acetyltransferase
MFSHIIAPNLELRPFEDRFAEEIFAVCDANRDHLRPFMGWIERTTSVDDVRKYIRECIDSMAKRSSLDAGIWENGRFIGSASFHHISSHRRYGEMGYWLAAGAQGRGIITLACRALILHAFDNLKLHRAEIRCDPDNVRSRAVATRLGFREEGLLRESLERYDGVMRDAVIYGVLCHEWKR